MKADMLNNYEIRYFFGVQKISLYYSYSPGNIPNLG